MNVQYPSEKKFVKRGFEPLRSRGEGTQTLVVQPLNKTKKNYVCHPLGKA